jgi:hypothetical protein
MAPGDMGEIGDRHRTQSGIVTGNLTAGRGDKIWRHIAVAICGNCDTAGAQA